MYANFFIVYLLASNDSGLKIEFGGNRKEKFRRF